WRPFSWLAARADMGLDLTDRVGYNLCRLQQCADFATNRLGFATDSRANTRNFSASLGADGTWQARSSLGLKTSVGAQYNNYQLDRTTSTGSILPPGAQTPSQGTAPNIINCAVLSKTLRRSPRETAQ